MKNYLYILCAFLLAFAGCTKDADVEPIAPAPDGNTQVVLIGFIGLAVPHVARILFADADHRILVPASILTGIVVMLLCDVLAKLLTFPINTITALLGIPIVIWVVIRNKSIV